MNSELTEILQEARALIARGADLDAAGLEARAHAAAGDDGTARLYRLFAVARAKRSLAAPAAPAPPKPKPVPPPARTAYRAKPTIAGNIPVRARAAGDAVALEWEPRREVARWEARIAERPDARAAYVDRETVTLETPRLELQLSEFPQRVSLTGRTASGRIVQRSLVSGLTSANWSQRWQHRPTAS